jgi:hypothetical protein
MKAHCNECLKVTNQTLLYEKDFKAESQLGNRFTIDHYQTLQCNGCEHITFRLVEIRDHITNKDGSPYEHEIYYPPEKLRQQPKWLVDLVAEHDQFSIFALLDEIYSALYAGSNSLVAIGIRSLIDLVMIAKVGDRGRFDFTLLAFQEAGFIAPKQKDFIMNTIDAGSASAHRGHRPQTEDLTLLLNIAESLIQTVFIFPKQSEVASKLIPPRPPRKETKL